MPQRFANKVALVAGGTGGLGRAVTLAFLEEGAKVIVTYRRQNEMDSLKQVAAGGGLLSGYAVDATHDSALAHLVQRITDEDGHLDVLVNAVGAYAGGAKFWEAEPAEFDRMLDVNLRSGHALLRAALPPMLKQASGAIVNVASRAAVDHSGGAAGYVASKSAAVAMIDSLAQDLKGTGVRANSLLP